jgi:hypothetical protein
MFITSLLMACTVIAADAPAGEQSAALPTQPEELQWTFSFHEGRRGTVTGSLTETSTAADSGSSAPSVRDPVAAPPVVSDAKPKCPKPKPPPQPYKGVFYDNDFSYLDDPDNEYYYLTDFAKRRHIGDLLTFDVGGEYRLRGMNEDILVRHDYFLLQRTRLYGNVQAGDRFRFYIEAIDAVKDGGSFPPRANEINRFDALNLFLDAKVLEDCDGDLWARGGRQELLYGAQRLVSPLDWSNTRRTFDGAKLFWKGKDWNVDGFWTRPVLFPQHLVEPRDFDAPSPSQQFFGLYATNKAVKGQALDFYYLAYTEDAGKPNFHLHTLGARWQGEHSNWLWETEDAYQFGDYGAQNQSAGMFTLGGGRKLSTLPWNPVLWVYFDWASGNNPTDSSHGTFNQLFPLGHKYFGYMDIVGRENIQDLNFQLNLSPHKKIELQLWHHIFHLQQARDALYDASGAPIRLDPTGAAGTDVGQELDLTARFWITPRADILCGYSHLFPGRFLIQTQPAGTPIGEDFYYTQFSLKF